MVQGTTPQGLDRALIEHFNPGDTVQVLLRTDQDAGDNLAKIARGLAQSGLQVQRLESGSTADWPHAIRIAFTRPQRPTGYAIIPIAVLLIGVLASAGIIGIGAWRITRAIEKNFMPLALLIVGGVVAVAWVLRPAIAPTAAALTRRG